MPNLLDDFWARQLQAQARERDRDQLPMLGDRENALENALDDVGPVNQDATAAEEAIRRAGILIPQWGGTGRYGMDPTGAAVLGVVQGLLMKKQARAQAHADAANRRAEATKERTAQTNIERDDYRQFLATPGWTPAGAGDPAMRGLLQQANPLLDAAGGVAVPPDMLDRSPGAEVNFGQFGQGVEWRPPMPAASPAQIAARTAERKAQRQLSERGSALEVLRARYPKLYGSATPDDGVNYTAMLEADNRRAQVQQRPVRGTVRDEKPVTVQRREYVAKHWKEFYDRDLGNATEAERLAGEQFDRIHGRNPVVGSAGFTEAQKAQVLQLPSVAAALAGGDDVGARYELEQLGFSQAEIDTILGDAE